MKQCASYQIIKYHDDISSAILFSINLIVGQMYALKSIQGQYWY